MISMVKTLKSRLVAFPFRLHSNPRHDLPSPLSQLVSLRLGSRNLVVLPLCRGLSALGPSCQILSQLTVISLTGSFYLRSDLSTEPREKVKLLTSDIQIPTGMKSPLISIFLFQRSRSSLTPETKHPPAIR
ncbi:hypothetical protein HZ326_30570 [Fusarium oxysporum f. sp. albedinis]|nr:hypothetical protein HZ326_30570 [Fusarium oxysporum f. sp. albedinis]